MWPSGGRVGYPHLLPLMYKNESVSFFIVFSLKNDMPLCFLRPWFKLNALRLESITAATMTVFFSSEDYNLLHPPAPWLDTLLGCIPRWNWAVSHLEVRQKLRSKRKGNVLKEVKVNVCSVIECINVLPSVESVLLQLIHEHINRDSICSIPNDRLVLDFHTHISNVLLGYKCWIHFVCLWLDYM